jgi:hypothetical protein
MVEGGLNVTLSVQIYNIQLCLKNAYWLVEDLLLKQIF